MLLLTVFLLVSNVLLESNNYFTLASVCSGGNYEVPDFLSATHINVAAASNGATCGSTTGSTDCANAIDGSISSEWQKTGGGVGIFVKITFARQFTINTLRIMQRSSTIEQNKKIALEFSGGEIFKTTLKRNTATVSSGPATWEVKYFPEVRSSWVKVTVESVYSSNNNGFREIEIYNRNADKGKLCDTLVLPLATKSERRPLFGRTVSLILKSSGVKVFLHSKDEPSAKNYTFGIGVGGKCTLSRFDSTDAEVRNVDCANILSSSGLRSVWIDLRSANIVLGSGTTVLFEYLDSSPFEVGYISFEATTETNVTLCNRENKCYQDADHYWPMDKISGGEFQDTNGGKSAETNISHPDMKASFTALNMYANAPMFDTTAATPKDAIFGDFIGDCIGDVETCADGMTLSFRLIIPGSLTTTTRLLGTRKTGKGFFVHFMEPSNINSGFYLQSEFVKLSFAIAKDKQYHIAMVVTKDKNLKMYANGIEFSNMERLAQVSSGADTLFRIGSTDARKGTFILSDVAVWNRELSAVEINQRLSCTQVGIVDESCSPAVKVPSVGSNYNSDQCTSITCCHDGSTCFRRDGVGTQATISTAGSIYTSSSVESQHTPAVNGKITSEDALLVYTAWSPSPMDKNPYLQIDTMQVRAITAVVVQGTGVSDQKNYVTTFAVSTSKSCKVFQHIMDGSSKKVFNGNTDSTGRVTVAMASGLEARCLRIEPIAFIGKIALKVKILGTRKAKTFHGCYKGGEFTAAEHYDSVSLTPEKCITACGVASKTYAALKYGKYCFCGTSVATAVADSFCNTPCSGNMKLTCGSDDAFSVYSVSGSFPTSFSCTTPAKVASLTPFSTTCTANSMAECDFGESLPVTGTNTALNHSYYSVPSDFNVFCKGYLDTAGESDEKRYDTAIKVYDDFEAELDCPDFAQTHKNLTCAVKVAKGTELQLSYQLPGQSPVSLELCDSIGIGLGETFDTPVGGSQEISGTIVLLDTRSPDDGQFLGIEVNVERDGCVSVQKLRPVCGSGDTNVYTYTDGRREAQINTCSFTTNCTDGQTFSTDSRHCVVNGSYSDNVTLTAPPESHEVVSANFICFTSVGRHRLHFEKGNISSVVMGDVFALYFPSSGAAKLSSRDSSDSGLGGRSSAVIYTGQNNGIGSVLDLTGSAVKHLGYSILFLIKAKCVFQLPLTYTTIGEYIEKVTVKSAERSQEYAQTIAVQEKIFQVTYIFRKGAVVNEPYNFTVNAHNGTSISYEMRFDNASLLQGNKTAALEAYSFFNTYSTKGTRSISINLSNGVSQVYMVCQIKVLNKVDGLNLTSSIPPQVYPTVTTICFKVTKGDEVTVAADFGNGVSVANGTFNIEDVFIGCFNHSYAVGVYHMTVNATNDASEQMITQLVIVEEEILELSFVVEHAARDIEVNETICVVTNVTQGTTPTYRVEWGDGQAAESQDTRFCRHYSIYDIYTINVTAFNNVSKLNTSQEIQVHKPVYKLVNFALVCPPTNFSNPTPCLLTIDGGTDFVCDWTFGDGLTGSSNSSHVGKPFNHLYAAPGYYDVNIKCTNRLYNITNQTLAIVEKPMIGLAIDQLANCPHGQSTTAYVGVVQGTGVEFTLKKRNFHTGTSVDMVPSFNPEMTNGSVTFACDAIGVYCMDATSVNNVTLQQYFTMCFKVDYTITGATATRLTPEYILVKNTSQIEIKMTQGSNVTCYFDFKDGAYEPPHFTLDVFPSVGKIVSHTYAVEGDFYVNIVCNNSVSEVTFINIIKSQHPAKEVFLVCLERQPFPPGYTQCTIDKPAHIATPTNLTCITSFGDGSQTTNLLVPPLVLTHTYVAIGAYPVDVACSNQMSSVNLTSTVEVQTPIDNDVMLLTTSGGLYGTGSPGRGVDSSYFPTKNNISLDVNWGNGTNVSVSIDWGDGTNTLSSNNSFRHIYTTAGTYTAKITMFNAVSYETKTFVLHLQDAVEGFTFNNNGPVRMGQEFIFLLAADQVGTEACYSLNIGNGTTYVYKPSVNAICEPECSSGTIYRTYTKSEIPMNITHLHYYIGNYDIYAVGCNKVSRMTFTNLANLSPKPCKYPVVNFTLTEANFTMETAVPYPKASRIKLTPLIKIDCQATKLSVRKWDLLKCNDTTGNCSEYSSNCTRDMSTSDPILVIPERCLEYGTYMVKCKVEMIGGGTVGIFTESIAYVKVIKSPLFAKILGGTAKSVGYGKPVPTDGTPSFDPDTGDNVGMNYFWFCGEKTEALKVFGNSTDLPAKPLTLQPDLQAALGPTGGAPSHLYRGCNGHGPGRFDINDTKIIVPTSGMRINHTYVVTVLVAKDTRWATMSLSMVVLEGNPPDCKIVCVAGCGHKINPSDKHSLKVEAICPECGEITYHWYINVRNKTTNQMVPVSNSQEMLKTELNFINIVVKPNMMQGDSEYEFRIEAYDTLHKIKGFAARTGITNSGPKHGSCDVQPKTGDNETPFNISCSGWHDDDDYLTFSVNLYDENTNILTPLTLMRSEENDMAALVKEIMKLPVGKKDKDFVQKIRIQICDPLLSCETQDVNVTVKLQEQSEGKFQEFLNGVLDPDGTINVLLGEGKIDDLCTYLLNTITTIKSLQATPALASLSEATQNLVQNVVEYSMNSTCQIVSSDSKKASCKSSVISSLLEVKTTITDAVKKQSSDCLMEAASDISNFPPSELANAATGLVSAFGSAIDSGASTTLTTPTIETTPEPQYDEYGTPIEQTPSPSKSSAEQEREKQEQKEQSMKLANTLNNIGGVLLQGMVPGEDLDIATPLLNISVSVKPANELKTVSSPSGTTIGGLGDAMPSNTSEAVSVKLFSFNNNPYGWADGASDVSGALISFKLGNDDGSDKLVKDTPKAFELSIKQTGQTINMTAHQLNPRECNYHLLEVPKNHSSIFVETIPSDPNVTIMLYLRRGDRPTKLLHDFNYTLSPNDTQVNATEKDKSRFMMFMSNDELNNTAAGTWKLAVCEEGGYNSPEEGDGASISYNISMFTAACMFLNETTGKFSDAGLKVGPATTRFVTQCFTTHATSFAGDFFVPPNKIDWSKISLDELLNNPIVFIVVMVIFGMYFILLIWARRADKKDLDKVGLTPLPDNDPRDNYLYEIVIYTGHAKEAGTTSEVYMILTGGLDETSPRQLKDPEPTRVKFLRGAVDYFLLAVPHSLGKLKQLRIWHNNTGSNPSWFLSRVMVRDLQTDTKTWFVNLRWLAVEEDDGQIDRTLQTATKEELTSFNLLFSTEARKNLTDNHLWFSVVARPPKSTFTRVQRLSCCLSVILTTMLANAMFYQTGDESSSGTSIHVGPFSFSIKQISIGITSSLVVLPVNIIVVTIFRKLRPPDPTKKKEDKEKDPHQQGDKYKPDDEIQVITEDASDIDEDDDDNDVEEANDKSKDKKAKAEKTKKKTKKLDPKFAYLAYFLIFIASTVSGTFTVFYGLTFGKEKSEGWISSMMISFWQDVLISQPLKVFAAAMFFALVIKDPNKNAEEETEQQGSELTQDEELVHKNVKNSDDEKALRKLGFVDKPPDPEKLEAARQLRLKQKQMKSIIQEMVQYLFFLVIMLIIAYGNRDPMAYGVTRAMQTFFVDSAYTGMDEFSSSDSPDKYWVWVDKTYLATLKPQYWYGPVVRFNNSVIEAEEIQKQRKIIKLRNTRTASKWRTVTGNYIDNPSVVHQYKENFVADHETAYLVGSPRIRQLRIKRDQCTMLPFARRMFNECNADYDWDKEDQESYLPSWKPFGVNDTKNPKSKSPWYYRSAWELKGTPYWGQFASYWAGGYVADFGSDRTRAEKMANLLSSQGWIDKYTRAVFAEFTVYNAYTNFFSAVTLLTEVRATGAYHHMPKVQTLRLYRYIGPEMAFIMACEITYIAFLLYFLYNQVKKYRNERQEYFKDAWNYLEIVVLAFSISSVGLYFARMGMTSYTLETMKESQDTFVSFQYVAFLDEWVSACCSLAVFFSFLKFLRLLRFNRRMALLTRTLKQAAGPLFYFFIYFGVIFLAYAQFGFAVFGCADDNYSSLHQTIVTLFGMTLGDIDFPSLLQANRLFGPLYFFSYVLVIIFILVNVFLSIICDTFNEVNRDVLNQANDHEIMSFMMHTVKQNIGKQVGPAIKPTYVEEKSKLEKDVDSIEEISDNIQYAFRNMCMEDIRQMKWFDTKNLTRKKKLLLAMLLEADENYCENDICDAIPIFDEYIANHNEEDIIQAVFAYREKRRKEEMQDVVSRMSDSSEEPSEYDTDSDAEDDYEKEPMPAPQFLSPHTVYDAHQASGNGQSQINVHGTHKSRRKSLGDALNTGKQLRRSSRGDLDVVSVGIGPRSPSCTDLYPDSTS